MHHLTLHHYIRDLKSAFFTKEGPWGNKPVKLKGSCAKGKTYERTIHRLLKKVLSPEMIYYNRWIRYEDSSGRHFAQPDIFILTPSKVYLLECKLTQTDDAEFQLLHLYKPLLEYLYPDKEVRCIQVCKNLRYHPFNEINSLKEAVSPNKVYTYHCIGETFNV